MCLLMYCTFDAISYQGEFLIRPLLIRYSLHNELFAVSKSRLHDVLGNQLYGAIPMVERKIRFNCNSAEGSNLRNFYCSVVDYLQRFTFAFKMQKTCLDN